MGVTELPGPTFYGPVPERRKAVTGTAPGAPCCLIRGRLLAAVKVVVARGGNVRYNPRPRSARRVAAAMPHVVLDEQHSHTRPMGYLLVILTRDTWMHRVDIARAPARALVLTPDHDGRLVADVVVERSRRHGRPFTLELEASGPRFEDHVDHDQHQDDELDARVQEEALDAGLHLAVARFSFAEQLRQPLRLGP